MAGFVGIAFSRSGSPHVLWDSPRVQGIDAIPGRGICRGLGDFAAGFVPHGRIYPDFPGSTSRSCIFQVQLRFPAPAAVPHFRIGSTLEDLPEFHISGLPAVAFLGIISISQELLLL